MSKNSIFVFVISFFIGLNAFAGIGNIGNGGNTIECSGGTRSKIYSVDYIWAEERFGPDFEIDKAESIQSSLERVSLIISKNAPALKAHFEKFFLLFKNQNPNEKYVWFPSENLHDVGDENINPIGGQVCPFWSDAATVKQAVIRKEIFGVNQQPRINLTYDRQIFGRLQLEDPTQLSFIIVHELLWDLNGNIAQNRNINYFLHSKNIETMSVEAVVKKLNSLGLKTN